MLRCSEYMRLRWRWTLPMILRKHDISDPTRLLTFLSISISAVRLQWVEAQGKHYIGGGQPFEAFRLSA